MQFFRPGSVNATRYGYNNKGNEVGRNKENEVGDAAKEYYEPVPPQRKDVDERYCDAALSGLDRKSVSFEDLDNDPDLASFASEPTEDKQRHYRQSEAEPMATHAETGANEEYYDEGVAMSQSMLDNDPDLASFASEPSQERHAEPWRESTHRRQDSDDSDTALSENDLLSKASEELEIQKLDSEETSAEPVGWKVVTTWSTATGEMAAAPSESEKPPAPPRVPNLQLATTAPPTKTPSPSPSPPRPAASPSVTPQQLQKPPLPPNHKPLSPSKSSLRQPRYSLKNLRKMSGNGGSPESSVESNPGSNRAGSPSNSGRRDQ